MISQSNMRARTKNPTKPEATTTLASIEMQNDAMSRGVWRVGWQRCAIERSIGCGPVAEMLQLHIAHKFATCQHVGPCRDLREKTNPLHRESHAVMMQYVSDCTYVTK